MSDILQQLANELQIKKNQAQAAVKLIDDGNTIPFIARYRKEMTGSLNDEVLRNLFERLTYLRSLEERKKKVIESIAEQGKLTDTLRQQIEEADTLVAVEDLYAPYKPRRRTRAMIAREKGLEPLAAVILKQETTDPLEKTAEDYLSDKEGKEVRTVQEALAGAQDILAEMVADRADLRAAIRKVYFDQGLIESSAKDKTVESVYEMYYQFSEKVKTCPGYRILAINRGEKEKILCVKVTGPDEKLISVLQKILNTKENPITAPVLKAAAEDAYKRLIQPAVERTVRSDMTEKAQSEAIRVFGKNLKQLLMQPPIAGKVVLGWDPAFRTGCKLAVVDATGKVMDTTVIYPTAPQNKVEESKAVLRKLIQEYHIDLISVGNGTASRESEQIIADLLKEVAGVQYVIVNEAGASVYSASRLAAEEFPNFDVGQRSAASIARRLQDPLAELVKIEPQSIGVGQYQHDMDQKQLSEALGNVVEDCVNTVGVDLNTASAALLSYVSGINKTLAANIVAWREENGSFTDRKQLLKVPKLGPKAYEQCAGFLRISGGIEPLDMTSVHPESYDAARMLLKKLGLQTEELRQGGIPGIRKKISDYESAAQELGIGTVTLNDILEELEKPARDPRKDAPGPILRTDVLDMKDLREGMILKGTVRNVIDFGAFVDIGVHQDGLVHISKMSDRFIKHPLEVVSVGDIIDVQVVAVDMAKKRISLTMTGF